MVERRVITAPQPFDVRRRRYAGDPRLLAKWAYEGRARAVCFPPGAPSSPWEALLTPRPPLNSLPRASLGEPNVARAADAGEHVALSASQAVFVNGQRLKH